MIVQCKITPEKIVSLDENEIFVFGSNQAGVHGAGAAYTASRHFGAEYGVGEGLTGRCYAFPTKDENIKTLGYSGIVKSLLNLEECVQKNPDKHFLITKVGCGLAGLSIKTVGRLFYFFIKRNYKNVSLPAEFLEVNKFITKSQIEELAISKILEKKNWQHISSNRLIITRPYPTFFWNEVDTWIDGFKNAIKFKK